jgi:hypothetical protein
VGALVGVSLVAMAGCSTSAALTANVTDRPDYSCEDITVPGHTLTDGRRASELSAVGRRTVLATEGVTRANLGSWRIVEDSTARVTIIRQLDVPEQVGGRVIASHQYVDRAPYRKADLDRSRWTSVIPLTCTLRELAPAAAQKAPAAKKPAAGKPGTKQPVAGKPVAKQPAAKAPGVRKAPAVRSTKPVRVPQPVPIPVPRPVAPEA